MKYQLCYFPNITNVFGIFHPTLSVLIFFSSEDNGDEGTDLYIIIMGLALIWNEINV